MKILSWNVNGLRAIAKKGFLDWLLKSQADIVCLQEIKADQKQIPKKLIDPKNYFTYLNPAQRKGYGGVLVYSKKKSNTVKRTLEFKRFAQEGRILELKYDQLRIINLYLPQGGRSKENLPYKLKVYDHLIKYLNKIRNKKVLLIGDFNIAHREIDLARPSQNKNNTMFTPKEREQIDKIIELGFTDTFRHSHKRGGQYTWWPYFYNARSRNLGWRIDYCFTSRPLTAQLKDAFILKKVLGSDHCPIGVEIQD